MADERTATVRMFGTLHSARRAAGLPTTVDVPVPESGATARQVALGLELDLGVIEGVFVDGTVYGIDHPVAPGDRVAFVPHGTPGPHRLYLGLYRAGRGSEGSDPPEDPSV